MSSCSQQERKRERGRGDSRVESTGSVISLTPSHSLSQNMSTKQHILHPLYPVSSFLLRSFVQHLPQSQPHKTKRKKQKKTNIQNNRRRPHKQQPRVLASRTARMHFRFLGPGQRIRHRGAGGEISGRRQRTVRVESEVFHIYRGQFVFFFLFKDGVKFDDREMGCESTK